MARTTTTRRPKPTPHDQKAATATEELTPFMTRLDDALIERVKKYADRYGVKKQFVVKKALERYLDEQEKQER